MSPQNPLLAEVISNYHSYVDLVVDMSSGLVCGRAALAALPTGSQGLAVFFLTPTEPTGILCWDSTKPDQPIEIERAVNITLDLRDEAEQMLCAVSVISGA